MFIIRPDQLEAFRIPLRKTKKADMLNSLLEQNWEMVFEEGDDIVVEDAKGRKSRLHYSGKNLLTELKNPSGVKYDIGYDKQDRLNKIELPNKESFRFAYKDDLPEKLSINDAGLNISYNKKHQISAITFPDNSRITLQYDKYDKLTSVTNRAGETQHYNTTIQNNKLVHELRDSLGRITLLRMDTFGGVEKIEFPDGSAVESFYDEDQDAQVTRLRNGKTRTVYSGELFQDRIEWGDGDFQELEFTDSQQIKAIENPSGTIAYSYDASGRPLTESFENYEVKYQYNADQLEAMVYPSRMEVGYVYTDDDQLKSITIDNKVVEYKYDPAGAVSAIRYPNGLVEEQKNLIFDGLLNSRLVRQGRIIASQEYDYDLLGRLKGYKNSDQENNHDWTFKYDNGDRLVLASEANSHFVERYAYDGKGNMVKAGAQDMLIGPMDEIRSVDGQVLQYDGAGNLLGFKDKDRGMLRFAYADNSTLIQAQNRIDLWEYKYDGLGRRILKSNGRETYRFFWAGDKMLVEDLTQGGILTRREYIYGESNVPLAFKEKGRVYWLHKDVRGAITKVSDDGGEIVWSASYSAFGEAQISIAQIRQPWRLSGQYFDDETGLHYNVARYYSPVLRTFLSLDPKWVMFGATNYSYAANDPYNRIDVDGNWPEWLNTANVVSVGAGIVAGIATVAVIGALAPAVVGVGATIAAVMVVGAISGAIGGLVESIVKEKMEGRDISWACAGKSALIGAAFGAVMGPVGKVVGKLLSPVFSKLKPGIASVTKGGRRLLNRIARKARPGNLVRTIDDFVPSSGTPLIGNTKKTTTVLGRWDPDMKEIKKRMLPDEFNVGAEFGNVANNKGGFNFLNIPDDLANASPDFFNQFNKPWLQQAIQRGDDIVLATRPVNKSDFITVTGQLKGMYAKELKFLVQQNHRPTNVSPAEWDTIKTWFQ